MSSFEIIEVLEDISVRTRFSIDRSRAFDPFLFTGIPGWRVGWQDHLALALHASDRVDFPLIDMRARGEYPISNKEQHKRARSSTHILLDAMVFEGLYRKPEYYPEAWKRSVKGDPMYVYFNGTELLSPSGVVHIPCLYWHEGHLRYTFERLTEMPRTNAFCAVLEDHPFK